MKPDYDKLAEAFKDSTSVVIGDVDCTSDEGKPVCEKNDVSGYPTIKYFTDDTGPKGTDYSGGRTYDALEKFVKETLAKKCDAKTKADCDDKEKEYIDKQASKGEEKWSAEEKRLEGMKGGDMKPDKRAWLQKRISILKGLQGTDAVKEEL